jgi:hypothetical protein
MTLSSSCEVWFAILCVTNWQPVSHANQESTAMIPHQQTDRQQSSPIAISPLLLQKKI